MSKFTDVFLKDEPQKQEPVSDGPGSWVGTEEAVGELKAIRDEIDSAVDTDTDVLERPLKAIKLGPHDVGTGYASDGPPSYILRDLAIEVVAKSKALCEEMGIEILLGEHIGPPGRSRLDVGVTESINALLDARSFLNELHEALKHGLARLS